MTSTRANMFLNPIRDLRQNSANRKWHRWIDTYLDSPDDIVEWKVAPTTAAQVVTAGPRSVVVLYTQDENGL